MRFAPTYCLRRVSKGNVRVHREPVFTKDAWQVGSSVSYLLWEDLAGN